MYFYKISRMHYLRVVYRAYMHLNKIDRAISLTDIMRILSSIFLSHGGHVTGRSKKMHVKIGYIHICVRYDQCQSEKIPRECLGGRPGGRERPRV